jgi:hypothetical protein
MVRMTKRSATILVVVVAAAASLAEADKKAPNLSGWKVDPMCTLMETGGNPSLFVKTILEGTETVTECPDDSEGTCRVGRVTKVKTFVLLHCTTSHDSPPQFECKQETLNLGNVERRVVDEMTMYFGRPTVKEFDRATGTLRIGPVYAALDLAVTGMKPSKDGKWAFGGSADLVGVGGIMVKSKIQLRGKCQPPPKD